MIWILDKNLKKTHLLKRYKTAQFVENAREVGEFNIDVVFCEENMYLLNSSETYYILYDQENCDYPLFGKIEKVKKENEEDADYPDVIQIEGKLSLYLLQKRVINGTVKYSGDIYDVIESLVTKCYNDAERTDRNISVDIIKQIDKNIYTEQNLDAQVTGGTLYEEIQPMFEQTRMRVNLYPQVLNVAQDLSEVYDNMTGQTNVEKFNLILSTGTDRRRNNKTGNKPIILSKSFSNIKRTDYQYEKDKEVNVAFVAGEGEEDARKWYEVKKSGNTEKAWNREELWVDARDIQSQKNDETHLTEEQYQTLIVERANEKFEENMKLETYEATMNSLDKRYVYGIDYSLGDWVTVLDGDLDVEMDAQITQVTTTVQDNNVIIDLELTTGKIKQTDEIRSLDDVKPAINSINNKIETILNQSKVKECIFPVGYVCVMVNNEDPGVYFGGVWQKVAQGRTLVGYNSSETEFNSLRKTGGAKTVTLTTAQIPQHRHSTPNHIHSISNHTHSVSSHTHSTPNHAHSGSTGTATTTLIRVVKRGGLDVYPNHMTGITSDAYVDHTGNNFPGSNHTHNFTTNSGGGGTTGSAGGGNTGSAGGGNTGSGGASNTGYVGSGSAHSNLQPYFVVHFWERVK